MNFPSCKDAFICLEDNFYATRDTIETFYNFKLTKSEKQIFPSVWSYPSQKFNSVFIFPFGRFLDRFYGNNFGKFHLFGKYLSTDTKHKTGYA